MPKSKVFFIDLRTAIGGESHLTKLRKLVEKAGIGTIDFQNKFVAIKVHFGEDGNLSYLRHNYAKVLVDLIKEKGGRPFLTDCATLYPGCRKDALAHLDCAFLHGYNPMGTGCHVVIGDGLKGTDEALVPVAGKYVTSAKIGRAIMDADIVISLNHFKGHEMTGFGGAIKNIGMGCGSRAGKMEMHCEGKPKVDPKACVGCKACAKQCGQDAIAFAKGKAVIDPATCVGCGRCIGACNFDAISGTNWNRPKLLNYRMAEYALAVLQGRPHFHVNLVIDVSPYCDCHGENDIPIVPNVGFFASFDPVALDRACVDACNAMPAVPGSVIDGKRYCAEEHFGEALRPNTEWRSGLEHAETLGLGTMDYAKIVVK